MYIENQSFSKCKDKMATNETKCIIQTNWNKKLDGEVLLKLNK